MSDFERLAKGLDTLIRGIFDAGRRAERERILSEIGYSPPRVRRANGYGTVTAAVKAVLEATDDGMTVPEVIGRSPELGERQVRNALKNLLSTGEINRLSRGRYGICRISENRVDRE